MVSLNLANPKGTEGMLRTIACAAFAVGLALHGLCAEAGRPSIAFGGVIPGAGVIHVPVRSMQSMHFIHVVHQQNDFSCGAASLATILKYAFKLLVTEKSVMAGLFTVSNPAVVRKVGFSLLDLKNYVDKIGLHGEGYIVNYKQLENVRIPVIVLLNLKGYKHFVVVERTTPSRVYIADPMLGDRVMPSTVFAKDWDKIVFAVFGKGYHKNNVLLTPVKQPSAKRLLFGRLPQVPLQPAHFGYNAAKYF